MMSAESCPSTCCPSPRYRSFDDDLDCSFSRLSGWSCLCLDRSLGRWDQLAAGRHLILSSSTRTHLLDLRRVEFPAFERRDWFTLQIRFEDRPQDRAVSATGAKLAAFGALCLISSCIISMFMLVSKSSLCNEIHDLLDHCATRLTTHQQDIHHDLLSCSGDNISNTDRSTISVPPSAKFYCVLALSTLCLSFIAMHQLREREIR